MSNSEINNNPGPLKGVKVLDLTRALSGPICAMILGDMGAEIIKIEEPAEGDTGRANQPGGADMAEAFNYFHRNKKSVTLNLNNDKGKDIFRKLIHWCDVVVENFRPGVMKRLGFDYSTVHEINPRVIYVSISGYGQTGPYSQRAGMDTVGQAVGGLMNLTGDPEGTPMNAGTAVADTSAGVFGALGAILALYSRQATGLGQHVDASLMESIVFINQWMMALQVIGGQDIDRGRTEYNRQRPGDGCYRTKDGAYIVIMSREEKHWPRMASIIGHPEFATAPGYKTRLERADHYQEIQSAIEEWTRSHSINEVESTMDKAGIPFGRVNTLADLIVDPHLEARNMFTTVTHNGKSIPLLSPYPILSNTPGTIRTRWPEMGQHNNNPHIL